MNKKTRRYSVLFLDMSFTLSMFRERKLHQALESRKLGGFFSHVISVHPLAGLFKRGKERYGLPRVTKLDEGHWFIEGSVGASRFMSWLPPLNFFLAQIWLFLLLYRTARGANVDVVRIGDPYYLGLFGLALSRLLRVPLVVRACADYDLLHAASGKAMFPRLFRYRSIEKKIERFIFPRCDLVAGANKNNLDYALAHGAKPDRGVVFRYGNLLNAIHYSEPAERAGRPRLLDELGLYAPFLMTVSRLEKMKQPEHNLYVLRELHSRGLKVTFLFVGNGSMWEELAATAKSFGLSKYVYFAGNCSQEVIASLLPIAQVVLSPHMGRGLTEACLAGAPIVAYDYDWQAEIIHGGQTGELVKNGDWRRMADKAMIMIQDRPRAHMLGKAAREFALKMMDPERLTSFEAGTYAALLGENDA
jgi:glycosyltransferase involved in cell wall biosynthesis